MSGFSTWQLVVLVFLAAVVGWFLAGPGAERFRKPRGDARATTPSREPPIL